jgi:hypothetical protein
MSLMSLRSRHIENTRLQSEYRYEGEGEVSSWRDGIAGAARSGLCFVLGQYANAGFWLLRNVTGRGNVQDFLGTSTNPYAQFYRWACDVEPPTNFENNAPFTGGQCPVIYRPAYTIVQYDVNGNITRSDTDPGVTKLWGEIRKPLNAYLVNGQGSQVVVEYWGYGSGDAPRASEDGIAYTQIAPFNPNTVRVEIQNLNYIRDDGLPDDCGDPPPVIDPPPGTWNHYDVDITYNNDDGIDVTVPVTFIFGFAFINATAELNIPFTLQLSPEFKFQGTLNVNTGDVHVDLFPTITNNSGDTIYNFPGSNGTYNINNNFDITGDRPPEPPNGNTDDKPPGTTNGTGKVIRGVIVTVYGLNSKKHTVLYQNENPDIYVPNLGFVNFKVDVNGVQAWTTDQPVKTLRHLIECPWMGGAIDVKGTPQPGIQFELTPVYAVSESGVQYPVTA